MINKNTLGLASSSFWLLLGMTFTQPIFATTDSQASQSYAKYSAAWINPYSLFDEYALNEDHIKRVIRKVADYQIESYQGNIPVKDWLIGTFYSSFIAAYEVTQDTWYLDQAYDWSVRSEWDINKPLNADDVCPGQTYLDLYFIKKDKAMLSNLDAKLSPYLTKKEVAPELLHDYLKKPVAITGRNIWSWCDALYMAPPVYARMGKALHDPRYYEMLDRMYWDSVDFLYSEQDALFHRNSKKNTEGQRTPNGKKVFWSRGNGWVIAGLSRMIPYLPQDHGMSAKYIKLYRDLAYSIAAYQMEDGLWRSSLNDPAWYPMKETSGSSFFVYSLAKGINEGWLPKEYFMPIVLRGWSGLMSCVTPQGRVGYSQVVAGSPYDVRPHDSKNYTTGAFILAATEMLKLNPAQELEKIMASNFQPRLVAKDGAWSSDSPEQIVFNANIYYATYTKKDGRSVMTTFGTEDAPSSYVMNEKQISHTIQSNTHNNAALLRLDDRKLITSFVDPQQGLQLKTREVTAPRFAEYAYKAEQTVAVRGVQNQLLLQLSEEGEDGLIYNVSLLESGALTMVYSGDQGHSWSKPLVLLSPKSGLKSLKCVSNEKDRIDFFFNTLSGDLAHLYYYEGCFYNDRGRRVKTLKQLGNHSLDFTDASVVLSHHSLERVQVIADVDYDQHGNPHVAYLVEAGDEGRLSYYVSTFNKKQWSAQEVAQAGSSCNDQGEPALSGITLVPRDESQVVISSNCCPKTGVQLAAGKHQLFKGKLQHDGWTWQQLTHDPVYDHLCPVIVRGDHPALFWMTGTYQSGMKFDTDILMSYGI